MDRMGSEPNLSVKRSDTIDTVLNFGGHGDGMCNEPLVSKQW